MVRFKNRYLLVHLIFPDDVAPPTNLTERDIISILRESLNVNFGDLLGSGMTGNLVVKYYSPVTSTLIIRCSRDVHRNVWAALTLLRSIKGVPVIVKVFHVSGTIRKTQHAAIAHNREVILAAFADVGIEGRVRAEEKIKEQEGNINALET